MNKQQQDLNERAARALGWTEGCLDGQVNDADGEPLEHTDFTTDLNAAWRLAQLCHVQGFEIRKARGGAAKYVATPIRYDIRLSEKHLPAATPAEALTRACLAVLEENS